MNEKIDNIDEDKGYKTVYVIKQLDEYIQQDEILYWNKNMGWADYEAATEFTYDEACFFIPPIEGKWVERNIPVDMNHDEFERDVFSAKQGAIT